MNPLQMFFNLLISIAVACVGYWLQGQGHILTTIAGWILAFIGVLGVFGALKYFFRTYPGYKLYKNDPEQFSEIESRMKAAGAVDSPSPLPNSDVDDSRVDQWTYLLDYREKYEPLFDRELHAKDIAELFLFRGWTTQLGYRLFTSDQDRTEGLIEAVVGLTKVLGIPMLSTTQTVDVETELGGEYMDLVEDRWRGYDEVFIANSQDGIPTNQIVGELFRNIGETNPVSMIKVCGEFLGHMEEVKMNALRIGLLTQ
jgi:hypothetical protein